MIIKSRAILRLKRRIFAPHHSPAQVLTFSNFVTVAGICLGFAGCSNLSQRPAAPAELGSVPLSPSRAGEVPNSLVFRVPDLDTRPPPRCFYIPPTEIAPPGRAVLFLNVTEQQKQLVADTVTEEFRRAIGRHQRLSDVPGPGCATLQLYLTQVTKLTPDQNIAANPYGGIMGMSDVSVRNLQASVNGTITVAGKFMAPNGTVLAAFVDKVGSGGIDIPPNASPREIATIAAAHIANDIAAAVDREVAVQQRHAQG